MNEMYYLYYLYCVSRSPFPGMVMDWVRGTFGYAAE